MGRSEEARPRSRPDRVKGCVVWPMRVMRVLSTRWLTRGRGWAVSTPARANISRNEVPRNLDKAYPFLDYTSHIGCFRGLLRQISAMRQNFAASKGQEVPKLGGTSMHSVVGQPGLPAPHSGKPQTRQPAEPEGRKIVAHGASRG